MHLEVPHVPLDLLQQTEKGESSSEVRQRVVVARQRQLARQQSSNAQMAHKQIEAHCELTDSDRQLLHQALLGLQPAGRVDDANLGAGLQGRWKIHGVFLPDDVLKKIYYENALKLLPPKVREDYQRLTQ